MELLEAHIEPKPARKILIVGGYVGIGPSLEHVMARHYLHEEVEIINIGAIEKRVKPDGESFSDSLVSVIEELRMIRRPELVMTLEQLHVCDPDDCSHIDIKKLNTKFYDHYYKGKRR